MDSTLTLDSGPPAADPQVPWLELTPRGGGRSGSPSTGRRVNSRARFNAPPSHALSPASSSEDLVAQRLAISEDECSSPATRRRRKALRGSAGAHPKRTVPPKSKSPHSDGWTPSPEASTSYKSTAELARLVQSRRQHETRLEQSRHRLRELIVAYQLSTRLVRCESSIRNSLLELHRLSDKSGFSSVQATLRDLRTSIHAIRRRALLDPDLDVVENPPLDGLNSCSPDSTFLHEIPTSTRDELLAFLSLLRSDPNVLAERIISLSVTELDNISLSQPTVGTGSVFASPAGSVRKSSSGLSLKPGPAQGAADRLLSFQRQDTFSILFSTLFAGPAEDVRRTDVWSTLFARLVTEPRPGGERLLHRILDTYANLRGWHLLRTLELFLMKVLRSGHFLVDSPEDHFPQSRFSPVGFHDGFSSRGAGFLQGACEDLFQLLDDDSGTSGLPEGVLEIGSASHAKLAEQGHQTALQRLIVHRWFLGRFLPSAITNPEHHGLMESHHVTDAARSTILRPLAAEVQKYINDGAYRWQHAVPVAPQIRSTMERMVSSVGNHRPAKAFESGPMLLTHGLAATTPMLPTLMLCPADIMALVNGLFPERRPPSRLYETHPSLAQAGWTSAGFPVSDSSAPVSVSSAFEDTSSVFSMSASSMTSDTTSRAPLNPDVRKMDSQTSLRTFSAADIQDPQVPDDEYGRRLRIACAEMAECLGPHALSGTCHPLNEQWALLNVSLDGRTLELHSGCMSDAHDGETADVAHHVGGIDSDVGRAFDNAKELKAAIMALLADNDLSDALVSGFSDFSIATSRSLLIHEPGEQRNIPAAGSAEIAPIYDSTSPSTSANTGSDPLHGAGSTSQDSNIESGIVLRPLTSLLQGAERLCRTNAQFTEAHKYRRAFQQLNNLTSRLGYSASDVEQRLVDYMSNEASGALDSCARTLSQLDSWYGWLQRKSRTVEVAMQNMCDEVDAIRDKMWYTTDVRHSVPYEDARNVVSALKAMGLPWKANVGRPAPPRLRHVRPSLNSFEFRQEGQALEILAAPANMAGSNKLSDEQSELISAWLADLQIHNLCKGEERIHRFCYEISRCADQLVADGVLNAPVLWSSELFQGDKLVLDRGYDRGDMLMIGLGHLQRVGEGSAWPQRSGEHSLGSNPFGTSPYGARNLSHPGISSPDHLRSFSPVAPTGSPGPTRIHGTDDPRGVLGHTPARPSQPLSAGGPRSAYSFKHRSYDKSEYLQRLRQRLISLLLSDFAPGLFNAGCETDAWLFGDIGTALMTRRMQRGHGSHGDPSGPADIDAARAPASLQRHPASGDNTEAGAVRQEMAASSDEPFDYHGVFHQLLLRLSAMVDPLAKLDALYQLQQLITASLIAQAQTADSAAIVRVFKGLFSDPEMNPGTLFRDLQYIASFVPSSVIDREPKGPAFWNAVLAAQSLKHEVCLSMVEVADAVVARNTERRPGTQATPVVSQPASSADATDAPQQSESDAQWARRLAAFTMADAAQMLIIAAKEGDAVAQRELGIFYLTHPEVLPRALAPFTKPKTVFKAELLAQRDREKQRRGGLTPERADPMTICIAQHWMQCSKKGGDQLAMEYLRSRDEIERIP